MIRTKRVEIHICDLCDHELLEIIKCGICDRELCHYHRAPYLISENRPLWYPYFDYLCTDCVEHYEVRDICDLVKKIEKLKAEVQFKVIGDEMGQLQYTPPVGPEPDTTLRG